MNCATNMPAPITRYTTRLAASAGAEAAEQVIALADRAGEEQIRSALFEVAQQRAADEDRDDQHAEQGEMP